MLLPAVADADHKDGHGHKQGEQTQGHTHDHRFELGVSPGLVFIPAEKELAAGLHAHAVVNILPTRLGVGLAYERLFDTHAHNTLGPVVQYHLIEEWKIFFAPGVSFRDEAPRDPEFSAHIETAYEFVLTETIHLGPSLAVAFEPDEVHLSVGLHVGIGI